MTCCYETNVHGRDNTRYTEKWHYSMHAKNTGLSLLTNRLTLLNADYELLFQIANRMDK